MQRKTSQGLIRKNTDEKTDDNENATDEKTDDYDD